MRWLGLVLAVAYPLLWWNARGVPDLWDPFAARGAVTAGVVAALLGVLRSPWLRRHVHAVALAVVYLVTTHAIWLVHVNALHPRPVVGLFVLLAAFVATATHTIRTEGQLGAYLLFTGTGVAVGGLVHTPGGEAQLGPSYVVMATALMLVLAYVAVRAQLLTLEGLARVDRSLRADIARREQVEQALRTSQEQALSLLRAIPDVLLRVTATGTLVAVSNPEGAPLAWELDDRVGEPLVAVFPGVEEAFAAAQSTRRAQTVDLTVTLREDVHFIELRVVPCGVEEVLVLVRDVTRERLAEQQVRVSERMVSLGTMASGIAHEINNPLAYVMANTEHVRRGLLERGQALDLVEPLEESLQGARRIRDIVSQMREQAQDDPGRLEPVDVDEALRTAIRMTNNHLRHRATLETDLAAGVPASASGTRLVQVLVNLLMNAVQALPERPAAQNRVAVRSRHTGGHVVLEVEDNGVGIAPEALGRVFDPFFTTKHPREGTGLGLYISHKHVRQMGGRLEVASRPGEGTTFRVVLAVARSTPSKPPSVPDPRACRASRLLVVDDEPQVGRALARLLSPAEVVVSEDAEDALRRCEGQRFDVVFCDMMMPGLDGVGFYERLAERDPSLASRVVFVTGGVFTDRARDFLASHPGRCLEKPLDLDRVVEIADRFAGASESAQA